MAKNFQRRRVGEIRAGQVLHTFGVGSVVDLPNMSVVVRGLDQWASSDWDPKSKINAIVEDRLLSLVRNHLGPQVEQLVRPPVPDNAGDITRDLYENRGVPVSPFPRWVRCPKCELLAPVDYGVFKLKTDAYRVDGTRYVHENCQKWKGKPPAVIPARFVVVCENGHLQDFPWHHYVGHKQPDCKGTLRLQERGVSSEVADLWVRCDECKAAKPLTLAFGSAAEKTLPPCNGCHPHLGYDHESECNKPLRTMLVGASNMWFPISVSSLWIPPKHAGKLESLVEENWSVLSEAKTREMMVGFRNVGVLRAFDGFSEDLLWEAISKKRVAKEAGADDDVTKVLKLKVDEWKVFSKPNPDLNSKDFRLKQVDVPPGYENYFEKVVLADRLRVVKALTGFTRIGSPGDYGDLSEIPDLRRAPLARAVPTWVPAMEVRGEGIFIQFKESAVTKWLEESLVVKRSDQLLKAHVEFRRKRKIEPNNDGFDIGRYTLIHTLSHALIRQISIDCGYAAASIQERIYSLSAEEEDGPMAGLLLYTAAADSEGTLGGLVALGDPKTLASHIDQALERVRLCASDPLCAESYPEPDGLTLHAAACHACMFVSETSCERGNKYLDRSVLIETMSNPCVPFFPSE
jgi:hypothetical protein